MKARLRYFILLLLLLPPAACTRRKVNAVVLITMESVGASDTTFGGAWATTDTTPVEQGTAFAGASFRDLDDIAYHGTVFTNAFANSGSAFASLVALHTGRAAAEWGVYQDTDRLTGAPTLAEMLSLRGVRCGAFVARPSLTKSCGLERGFETYLTKPRDAAAGSGDAASDARAWLDSVRLARPDQPVFVWLHLSMPRPPYEPRDEWIARILAGAKRDDGTLAALENYSKNPASRSPEKLQMIRALHAAAILQDAAVAARLLEGIEPALQNYKSTMFIFAGVNADEAGRRASFGSARGPRDAALKVPLFVYSAAAEGAPKMAGPVVDSMDIAPTITHAFGFEPPVGARGKNLYEIAADPEARDRATFVNYNNQIFSLRTRAERLICNPARIEPGGWPGGAIHNEHEELYDSIQDPQERENLAHNPGERLVELRAMLEIERGRQRAGKPVPETDPERLKLIKAEAIHEGRDAPAAQPLTSSCGGK